MSTSKLDASGSFQPVTVQAGQRHLSLPAHGVAIRPNGIEFLTSKPLPLWTEVTVELRAPLEPRPVRGSGVVVDCTGSRHTGYVVSLVLMNLTRQSQARLSQWASLRPA
jgi:hypothetical protein